VKLKTFSYTCALNKEVQAEKMPVTRITAHVRRILKLAFRVNGAFRGGAAKQGVIDSGVGMRGKYIVDGRYGILTFVRHFNLKPSGFRG
jgi:hypothetical protein